VTHTRTCAPAARCGVRELSLSLAALAGPGAGSRSEQGSGFCHGVNVRLGDCTQVTFRPDTPSSPPGRARCGVRALPGRLCIVNEPSRHTRTEQGRRSCVRTQRANKRFTCKSANVCGFVLVENPLLDPNLLGVVSEPGLVLRRSPLRARDRSGRGGGPVQWSSNHSRPINTAPCKWGVGGWASLRWCNGQRFAPLGWV